MVHLYTPKNIENDKKRKFNVIENDKKRKFNNK